MSDIKKLFEGFSQDKIADAIRRAELLSKNEEIRKAFSTADKSKLKSLFDGLDGKNREEVLNAVLRSNNKGIKELLKKIKG